MSYPSILKTIMLLKIFPLYVFLSLTALADSFEIATVIDGDTLHLRDGRKVRILAIDAPELNPDNPLPAEPFALEAKNHLEKLTQNKKCHLTYGGRRSDRHGRILAHLWCDDQLISRLMVKEGLARVYSFADNTNHVKELLILENQARTHNKALWQHPANHIRTPEQTHHHIGSFQTVEGCIHQAAFVRKIIYLNFDEDWRYDFTIKILPAAAKKLKKQGITADNLTGTCIRVRGWIIRENGPLIRLDHLEPLEFLTP